MFGDLPLMLQVALGMVAVFDGLLALLLVLSLLYLGYIKWLTHHGQMVEGTITSVTQEKPRSKRGPRNERYEVTWTDPRTLQSRRAFVKYRTAIGLDRTSGDAVPVYVHPTFSRLRTVRLWEDSSLLWQAWQEGRLLPYLAGVFVRALWIGGVVAALCLIPALANFFENWQLGLGILLGGFLVGLISTWIGGLLMRR